MKAVSLPKLVKSRRTEVLLIDKRVRIQVLVDCTSKIPREDRASMKEDAATDSSGVSHNQIVVQLFLISLLSLFCEMLVIRWLSTEIRVFAYFKNLPLMAAFFGLGLGFLWTNKKPDLMKWSSTSLLYFSGLMLASIGIKLTHLTIADNSKIMLFGDFAHGEVGVLQLITNVGIMVGVFALAALIFVGLGQRTGRLFEKLTPLYAYSINVAGALVGIILFAIISNLALDPGIWLIVAGILYLVIERRISPVFLIVFGIAYSCSLAPYMARMLFHDDYVTTVWSPYYRIDVRKARMQVGDKSLHVGYDIFINYDSFQSMLDCTPALLAQVPQGTKEAMLDFYERSFRVTNKQHPDVLILGAGSGSDVAAALRCKANHVDAVEIDRCIYDLGKQLNPEHPYDSPKVTAYIMDARTYLKNCRTKYDVIVYALLDSHTAFSSLSSLRTDNYVFTVQSFKDAAKLLKPDGYIAVCFVCFPDWLFDRHSKDLYMATHIPPRGYFWQTSLPTGFLVSAPNIHDTSTFHFSHPPRKVDIDSSIPEITDDWPFLFLPSREIPFVYILPLLAILAVSLLPVSKLIMGGSATLLNWQMFCLGMGFMLLEVRAISAMSLLCGATWTVNSVVISGVMVAILLGNFIALRLPTKAVTALAMATMVTTLLSSMVDVSSLNLSDSAFGLVIGTAVYLLPLLFAASVFSTLFKQTDSASRALAFNIIGGVLGVAIEYASMIGGIKALAWFAVTIYAGIILLERLRLRRTKSLAPLPNATP